MDCFTAETRSAIMSRIGSSGTLPERILEKHLRCQGIRFRRRRDLPGRPDFFIPEFRAAIFVHGCFWHSCPIHGRRPKTNKRFWNDKLDRNRRRDRRVVAKLRMRGIKTIVVWEHDLC